MAKQWAADRGLDTGQLAAALTHPGPDPQPDQYDQDDANAWARSVTVIRQVAAITADQGSRPGEPELLAGRVDATDWPQGAGVNETREVRLDTGVVGYHKSFVGSSAAAARSFGYSPEQLPIHEVAAWRVAHGLGPPWSHIVPPVVLRNIEGRLGSFARGYTGQEGAAGTTYQDLADRAGFFDELTGQQDRHFTNRFSDGRGLALIDHGYGFARPGEQSWSILTEDRVGAGRAKLYADEVDALDRLLADRSLFGLTSILEMDRADEVRVRAVRMRQTRQLP